MAKAFSNRERELIKEKLMQSAAACIMTKGMQKTTVDEIVAECHIAKGSFYHFYATKELLFWDVINQWHDQIHKGMMGQLQDSGTVSVDSMTDLLTNGYEECFRIGLGKILMGGEMDYLMRKLPEEVVMEHLQEDDDIFEQITTLIPDIKAEDAKIYTGAFRGIFLFLMYEREIGPQFHQVLYRTIRGIVLQMMQE